MRGSVLLGVVVTAITALAAPEKRSNSGTGPGSIELTAKKVRTSRRRTHNPGSAHVRLPESVLNFTNIEYLIDYKVGDQELTGIFDTGSSDTWGFSTAAGSEHTFDPEKAAKSSAYHWTNNNFKAAYGDGSNQISGSWASDTISVGGASVANYPFAFANQSSPQYFPDNMGIFGCSVKKAETRDPSYTPYVQRLKDQGTIDSNSFTIFTSNEDSTEATIIFGGVDSAKYDGPLYKLPRTFEGISSADYLSVDAETDDGEHFEGIWDTGTSLIMLPQTAADNIAEVYGFKWEAVSQTYVSQNADLTGKPPFNLTFSGVTIQVPPEDMVIESEDGVYTLSVTRGLNEFFTSMYILGDPILRQISLTVDLDNDEYAIAPVKQSSDSNVEPIESSIPSAVTPSGYSVPTTTKDSPGGGFPFPFTLPPITLPTSFDWPWDQPTTTSSPCTAPVITGSDVYDNALRAAQQAGNKLASLHANDTSNRVSTGDAKKIYAESESLMEDFAEAVTTIGCIQPCQAFNLFASLNTVMRNWYDPLKAYGHDIVDEQWLNVSMVDQWTALFENPLSTLMKFQNARTVPQACPLDISEAIISVNEVYGSIWSGEEVKPSTMPTVTCFASGGYDCKCTDRCTSTPNATATPDVTAYPTATAASITPTQSAPGTFAPTKTYSFSNAYSAALSAASAVNSALSGLHPDDYDAANGNFPLGTEAQKIYSEGEGEMIKFTEAISEISCVKPCQANNLWERMDMVLYAWWAPFNSYDHGVYDLQWMNSSTINDWNVLLQSSLTSLMDLTGATTDAEKCPFNTTVMVEEVNERYRNLYFEEVDNPLTELEVPSCGGPNADIVPCKDRCGLSSTLLTSTPRYSSTGSPASSSKTVSSNPFYSVSPSNTLIVSASGFNTSSSIYSGGTP